jgi:uncharacterized protein YdiU (UPF0061 family)
MGDISKDLQIDFNNTYNELPKDFYKKVLPAEVRQPQLIFYSSKLSDQLKIPQFSVEQLAQIFSGQTILEGSDPISQTYAGHQFGYFVPQLGDGRALLLGEVLDSKNQRFDLQLKGSGPTPFSRGGDGLAPIGPMLREFIVSEAMHALGVPTTRALALVTTGNPVYRDKNQSGAILTRVAASHIRVGTFEFFASRNDFKNLKILADYVIERHYPEARSTQNPYLTLLQNVMNRQARLIARWMGLGFIHGVMNTDNMTVSGETIDYGPCAFMDYYDSKKVFSFIDKQGRYAYDKQPSIAKWNLSVFASTLLPLIADPENENFGSYDDFLERKNLYSEDNIRVVQNEIDQFEQLYSFYWLREMQQKLGISHDEQFVAEANLKSYKFSDQDRQDYDLAQKFLNLLESQKIDFTLAFRYLADSADADLQGTKFAQLFLPSKDLDLWITLWKARVKQNKLSILDVKNSMLKKNPLFIPRNHWVDKAIQEAEGPKNGTVNLQNENKNDFNLAEKLLTLVTQPFAESRADNVEFTYPPKPGEQIKNTFCGT